MAKTDPPVRGLVDGLDPIERRAKAVAGEISVLLAGTGLSSPIDVVPGLEDDVAQLIEDAIRDFV